MGRLARVFEQTYTRFLDLQKAEAQAKEAQIEAALERVRSRSMAMHKSEELSDAALLLHQQFSSLAKLPEKARMVISILNEEMGHFDLYITGTDGSRLNKSYSYSIDEPYVFHPAYLAVKRKEKSFIIELSGESLAEYVAYLGNLGYPITFRDSAVITAATFSSGYFCLVTAEAVSDVLHQLLHRFAKVFEQTYIRFNDLKQAEAQAKEAQIQLALERVRARTMAMHKSDELLEAASLLYGEFRSLGITQYFTCGFVLVDEESHNQLFSITDFEGKVFRKFKLPLTGDPVFQQRYDSWNQKEPVLCQEVGGDDLKKHLAFAIPHFGSKEAVEMATNQFPDPTFFYMGNFSHGYLHIVADTRLTTEEETLLARFTQVFEMTYKRFLDLQKAEEQTREGQIENALEKVRSRTMAMQRSEELPEAANNLFLQVQALGIPAWSAGYCIWTDENKKGASCNMSTEGEIQKSFILPTIGEGYDFYDPLQRGEAFYIAELGGEELVKHYEFMLTLPVVGEILDGIKQAGFSLPTFQIFHIFYFPQGYLMFITYESVPEAHDIFKRFAKVFEQTYTRFLDLQKAEAQAREAQIEAALERVRSRSMAMHSTEELEKVSSVVYEELIKLGITTFQSCGFHIIDEQNEIQQVWNFHIDLKQLTRFQMPMKGDPILDARYAAWKQRENVFYQKVGGQQLNDLLAFISDPDVLLGSTSS
ncbi:MAG: hypothetical protein MUP26_03475, partial [Desulfobulbaceae bacterium]|nr:hypothetical protein [Desulfobulbaceae bacterium]